MLLSYDNIIFQGVWEKFTKKLSLRFWVTPFILLHEQAAEIDQKKTITTTAHLYLRESELTYWANSNPARSMSLVCDGDHLQQWSREEIDSTQIRCSAIPQNNLSSSSSSLSQWSSLLSLQKMTVRWGESFYNKGVYKKTHKFRTRHLQYSIWTINSLLTVSNIAE